MSVFMQDLKLESKEFRPAPTIPGKCGYMPSALKVAFCLFVFNANDAPFGLESSICAWDGNPEHNPGPLQSHQISKDNSEN